MWRVTECDEEVREAKTMNECKYDDINGASNDDDDGASSDDSSCQYLYSKLRKVRKENDLIN